MTVFRVGMKVCVVKETRGGVRAPFNNSDILTVERIWDDHLCLVEWPAWEIPSPHMSAGFLITAWNGSRFRPIVERTLDEDVELVKSLLTDDPVLRLDLLLEDMDAGADVEGSLKQRDLP